MGLIWNIKESQSEGFSVAAKRMSIDLVVILDVLYIPIRYPIDYLMSNNLITSCITS